jgi:hypothetical protein
MARRKAFFTFMKKILFYISLPAMISGCTGLGKIAENQYLVTEYKINLEKKEHINHKGTQWQISVDATKAGHSQYI